MEYNFIKNIQQNDKHRYELLINPTEMKYIFSDFGKFLEVPNTQKLKKFDIFNVQASNIQNFQDFKMKKCEIYLL